MGGDGLQGNIHAQHADELAGGIDRDEVGAGGHFVEEMRRIGAHPGGAAALDGGIVPGGVLGILGVEGAGVQRLTLHEAGLADPGVEEAVHVFTDFGIDAVVIGDDAVCVPGGAFKGLEDIRAVLCEVGVQAFGLLGAARLLLCVASRRAALHQHHAVQRVHRHVGGQAHRLLDAGKVFIQGVPGILADEPHDLHRAAVRFGVDGVIARAEDGEDGEQDRGDGDRRDLKADRIEFHCSQASRMDISRYMFLTEPFQDDWKPSSRSDVT